MGFQDSLRAQGFVRVKEGAVLGGVCAGLARKFGTDIMAMRALVIVLMIIVPGSPLLLYPLMWILMPAEATPTGQITYNPPNNPQS